MFPCQLARQKNKRLRTVVNKLNSIDTQFRFFKMELLAGEPNYIVEHVGFPPLPCFPVAEYAKHRSNPIVVSSSISPVYTGTLGYTRSMHVLWTYFGLTT